MGRVRSNLITRLALFIAGIFSVRLISTFLHMTTLEKVYKPRDFRKSSHLELSPEIISRLPRYCQTIFGRKMDPINLVFIGTEAGIRRAFEKAGWDGAHPSTPVHLAAGLASSLFNKSYRKGPFMPLFISIGLQDLAFQKVVNRTYSQRHHIRIWRTRHVLPNDNRVWVAAATYEKAFKVVPRPPYVFHHMEPNLDFERDYICRELLLQGHKSAGEPKINPHITEDNPGSNPNGDTYFTDGRAKVIEII